MVQRSVAELQNPEYTGENRCVPCTVVNAVLTVALAAIVAAVASWLAGPPAAAVGSVAVLVVGALAIWLRGYLVPGTPTLTKRYMPAWMLAWFGKEPAPTAASEPPAIEDVESVLVGLGVLEFREDVDDLRFTDAFERDLDDALEALDAAVEPGDVTEPLGLHGEQFEFTEYGDAVAITREGRRVAKWPSRTALLIDAAAARVFAEYDPDWAARPPEQRSELVAAARLFVEECPDGSAAELSEETVESCCSTHEVVTIRCTESGDRLFEEPVRGG